ncbi:MAG TPA: hypothetical protein DHW02_24495, partial [Ktedonobacter sp.]|nr:hypothetical protein [Ktedonobacter sp.]
MSYFYCSALLNTPAFVKIDNNIVEFQAGVKCIVILAAQFYQKGLFYVPGVTRQLHVLNHRHHSHLHNFQLLHLNLVY